MSWLEGMWNVRKMPIQSLDRRKCDWLSRGLLGGEDRIIGSSVHLWCPMMRSTWPYSSPCLRGWVLSYPCHYDYGLPQVLTHFTACISTSAFLLRGIS